MIWNVVDRFFPTYVRSRDGAYVLLQLKAENPNQPLSSVEKGCGDCEPMNVRAAKPPVNRKFAVSSGTSEAPSVRGPKPEYSGDCPTRGAWTRRTLLRRRPRRG